MALRVATFLLAASLFGCDHGTKLAAKAALEGGRVVPVLEGVLELRFAKNEDIAFSVLRGFGLHASPSLLVALSVASLGGLTVLWLAMRRQATLLHHVAFALVVSGALGNVADRYARGYVVDFIHLARWPIFNVADIAVVLGMGILVVAGLRSSRVPSAGLE